MFRHAPRVLRVPLGAAVKIVATHKNADDIVALFL